MILENILKILFVLVLCGPLLPGAQEKAKPKPAPQTRADYLGQQSMKLNPDRKIIYKKAGGKTLELHIFEPKNKQSPPCPAFVVYHGGGWASGNPRRMYAWANWAAGQGMLGISVQYRLYSKTDSSVTVFDCARDARAALRHVRAHCEQLNIDPDKIIAIGASAGAHLALGTALFDGIDEPDARSETSSHPNALVLFSAVTDTTNNDRIGERWRELSPLHRITAHMPPTLMFHGTADKPTPYAGAKAFFEAMLKAGNHCEMVTVQNAPHVYMFKSEDAFDNTKNRIRRFLMETGFLRDGERDKTQGNGPHAASQATRAHPVVASFAKCPPPALETSAKKNPLPAA